VGGAGDGVTRRAFLRGAAAVGGWAALGGPAPMARAARERARVALVRSARVLQDGSLNAEVLGRMVDRAVMVATGLDSADKAWASLFSSDEVVGIKPNGLGGSACSTAPELIEHCVKRLHGVGVRPGSILVWEDRVQNLTGCGIDPGSPPWGLRAYEIHDHLGDPVTQGGFTDRLFAPLQDEVDAILNLPILKCHPICGVTLAMKNHYGSIANPAAQHYDGCHTPLVDLSEMPAIRDKTRLVVCDGTRALVEGEAYGEPQAFPNLVLASTDVVAHDAVGARLVDEERARQGLRPLGEVGLAPRYIAMAAERGLGVADLDAILCPDVELL